MKEVKTGHRPHNHFNKSDWNNIIADFRLESGRKYKRAQLKNKWDCKKKDWRYWKEMLKDETGLGWNHNKQTINASYDWWKKKIQVHKFIFF